jgi:hypothetical protein
LSKSTLDLDVPRARYALARCSAIFLIGLVENVPSTDFEFNVSFFSGFDREHQPATPIDVASSAITSANSQGTRSTDYTTVANFLADSRFQVWWRNPWVSTGTRSHRSAQSLG